MDLHLTFFKYDFYLAVDKQSNTFALTSESSLNISANKEEGWMDGWIDHKYLIVGAHMEITSQGDTNYAVSTA